MLSETEFNYHKNGHNQGEKHDLTPYKSDNKYVMDGRGTGHFGSGTYFSTFKQEDPNLDKKYGEANPNQDKRFIEIADKVYRVDLDLYKNLYRVRNERQGDVLYSLLRYLNVMFNRINTFGRFKGLEANYSNASLYQKIERNAEALNLKCPSYLELTRMAQKLGQNENDKRSFSTMFMEYNGYNGVNVSGIPMYDNTMHGSVIYDLSKVDSEIHEVSPESLWNVSGSYQNITVNSPKGDKLHDHELNALYGKSVFWHDEINDMPLQRAVRILKNYIDSNGKQLGKYMLKSFKPELQKRYLKLLFKSNKDNLNLKDLIDAIKENNAYYWVNYVDEYYKRSGLIALLNDFEWDLDYDMPDEEANKLRQQYLHRLMAFMNRDLEQFEEEWLEKNGYL